MQHINFKVIILILLYIGIIYSSQAQVKTKIFVQGIPA